MRKSGKLSKQVENEFFPSPIVSGTVAHRGLPRNYAGGFRPWNLFVVYRRSPGILNRRSSRFSPRWRSRRSTMISSTITRTIKIPISTVSPLSHGQKSFTSERRVFSLLSFSLSLSLSILDISPKIRVYKRFFRGLHAWRVIIFDGKNCGFWKNYCWEKFRTDNGYLGEFIWGG